MFNKFSIRSKIISIVSLLLLGMVALGLLAGQSMRVLHANAHNISAHWLPSVKVLGELHAGTITYRATLRAHLLAETVDEKAAVEKALEKVVENNIAIGKSYQAMITSPEERALYEDWSKNWQDYKDIAIKVMALSRKEAGKLPREALELNKQAVKIGNESDDILRKDIGFNNRGAESETALASETYSSALTTLAIIVVIAIILGVGFSFYVVRDISTAIASIIHPMQALGQGDLAAEVPHQGDRTEIGAMAGALQVFKEALIAKRIADEAAASDAEAKIERGRRVDGITREFEQMIGEIVNNVSSASTQLEASAGTLSSTAKRSKELSTTVAAASEEASANVQSVASSTEELSCSINEISHQVQESARMASAAVAQARATSGRVSELSNAATRIGDVIELINTIAGQTNLLALNATIEAARAGDAGRGFAVVASEVKALAEQTAKATGEIGTQINGIQGATQESVNAIREISDTIDKLSEIVSAIAAAVEEQGAATQEISRNVQQAAQGTQQVSSSITDVQHGATETGSASSQVLSAAQTLSSDSGRLKSEVSKFLTGVRAA
ncbi:MCP four helix bundle domain-containing protein [Bradyrhizobium manausense]|uniref:methyl-accepting chemotaxis protein n=1 Tax=Bradyrhizobium manausense TaxID=989370 RepID=UPI001BA4B66C|nr:methyl-accepting chemotaxis protein [Bradyrhizobium manausense]MBR0793397.1 MCP four helix bundle domain-containing protein [Bradyrhizobium manausense]